MSPLERLFRLEIEFHRCLRTLHPGTVDASSVHASYALQSGYDRLLRSLGPVADPRRGNLYGNASLWQKMHGTCSPPAIRSSRSWGYVCPMLESEPAN